jgi:hypothetical protein
MLGLVGVDERGQQVEAVSRRRPAVGPPEALELDESVLVVCLRADLVQLRVLAGPPLPSIRL